MVVCGLGDDAGSMRFLDDRLLSLGRELQIQVVVRARAVFQKVDAAADIFPDFRAHLVGCHVQERRTDVLFPDGVDAAHQRLRRRRLGVAVELAAERPAEADDVAGDEHAAADHFSFADAVADVEQRLQRPPRVEYRRDAVLQRHLRGFLDQIFVVAFVAHDELDRRSEHKVNVRVHQPGDHELAGGVDRLRVRRDRDGRPPAGGGDSPVGDDDHGVADRLRTRAVDERRAGDRDRRSGGVQLQHAAGRQHRE